MNCNPLTASEKGERTDTFASEAGDLKLPKPETLHEPHTLEEDFNTASHSAQAESGYWKHRNEVSRSIERNSYTGLRRLEPVHLTALAHLVEQYEETCQEIASARTKTTETEATETEESRVKGFYESATAAIIGAGDPMNMQDQKQRQLLIAESPSATAEILAELALSAFVEVREAVADHKACPASVHIMFLQDDCIELRYAMAENHNLNTLVLEKLAEDDNPFVAARAEQTMRRLLSDNIVNIYGQEDWQLRQAK